MCVSAAAHAARLDPNHGQNKRLQLLVVLHSKPQLETGFRGWEVDEHTCMIVFKICV